MSHAPGPPAPPSGHKPDGGRLSLLGTPAAAVDPVCHMTVDPATAPARCTYEGQTYYFCNASCRARFLADPQRYLAPGAAPQPMAAEPAPPGGRVEYTCPM